MQKKEFKILIIAMIIVLFCFLLFCFVRNSFVKEDVVESVISSQPVNDVDVFASEIINEYRFKNDYAGLYKTYKNLVAGDESAQALGYGSKNFMIVGNDLDAKECRNLLMGKLREGLSLISVDVNGKTLYWGDGLPLMEKNIESLCVDKNKIVWSFS